MSTPYHRAAVHLRHARSVVVCGHVRPDGDAVGAVLGLTLALRDAGIPAVPTLADEAPPPRTYSFLPGFALYVPVGELEQPDVFVSCDAPSFDRVGLAEPMAREAETVIVIDHHPDNAEFGTVNLADPQMSASGQIVWHLLERLEITPSPEVAMCCYVALMTDTGRFQHDNTTADALRDGAAMIDAGVDPSEAARLVYQERSAGSLALEACAMSRLTLANNGHVAWSWVADEDYIDCDARPEDAEYLPDALRRIGGVDVVVLLRHTRGEIRGNLRSKTGFDVGAVAREFGGGGHKAASGFTFEGAVDELLPRLLAALPGGAAISGGE